MKTFACYTSPFRVSLSDCISIYSTYLVYILLKKKKKVYIQFLKKFTYSKYNFIFFDRF